MSMKPLPKSIEKWIENHALTSQNGVDDEGSLYCSGAEDGMRIMADHLLFKPFTDDKIEGVREYSVAERLDGQLFICKVHRAGLTKFIEKYIPSRWQVSPPSEPDFLSGNPHLSMK